MISEADELFKRWAVWTLAPAPIGVRTPTSILQRIESGQGCILPGPPRNSGKATVPMDTKATSVEMFLAKKCNRSELRLIRGFYLEINLSAVEKAKKLGIPTRTMYYRVEKVQKRLLEHLGGQKK